MNHETYLKYGSGIMDICKWSGFCNHKTTSSGMPWSSGSVAKFLPLCWLLHDLTAVTEVNTADSSQAGNKNNKNA